MADPNQGDKKIIIDEDWKSQVEAEKEAAAADSPSPGEPDAPEQAGPLPTADLTALVTSLAMQTMNSLGQLPAPDGSPSPAQPEQAKYFIDLLSVLEEKTSGNRTPEESSMFTELLHQLRMAYVALTGSPPGSSSPS